MHAGQSATPELRDALQRAGLDTVAGAFAYRDGETLDKPGLGTRERIRLRLSDDAGVDHSLYLKRYGPERLADRLRRMVTYGPRRSPAIVEADNIRRVLNVGLKTMHPLLSGQDVGLLFARRSFLIVTAVPGEALERCGEGFLDRHEDDGAVEAMTADLAGMIRTLHEAGYVHRDLYASHVFLNETQAGAELYLIDVARVFAPRWRRFRWRAKDLAQLLYSMPDRWARKHWDGFLAAYLGGAADPCRQRYDAAVRRRVERMRRQAERRQLAKEGGRR